jgi:AsmA protein
MLFSHSESACFPRLFSGGFMKGIMKYVLIGAGVLVLLLIAIPFFISPNQFRPTIEEKLSAALGRPVKVGNLSLSLFSGSLGADDLSIGDDPAFSKSAFLTAKSLKVGVEMMPLIFSKALHVTGVTIEKPEIVLIKDAEGKWNFASLATSDAKTAKSPSESGSAPDLRIKKLELTDGRITVKSTTSTKSHVYENLHLEASDVSATSSVPFSLTAKLPGGGDLKVEGKAGPVDSKDATLSPLDAKISISALDLAGTGFVDSSTGIAGLMDFNSSVVAQGGEAHAQGTVKLNKLQVRKGGAPSGVPVNVDFDSNYDLRRSAGTLKEGTVKIGNAVAHLAGTYDLKGEVAVLNMKINAQNMPVQDLQSFLPALGVVLPKGSSLQQGTLSANLNAQGPTDKLVTSGNIGLYDAKLAGFDLGSKLSAISALTGAKSGSDTSIQKLTTNVRVAPDGIRAEAIDLVMPALGAVTGGGMMSAENNLDFKMVASLSSSGGMGAVGGLLGGGGKGTKIPFRIQGTTADPKFVPDMGGAVAGLAQGALGNLAGGLIKGKKSGQGVTDALGGLFGKKN